MDEKQLRILGHNIADKADNYLALTEIPEMPQHLLVDGLKQGLEEISAIAKLLYINITNTDPWNEIN